MLNMLFSYYIGSLFRRHRDPDGSKNQSSFPRAEDHRKLSDERQDEVPDADKRPEDEVYETTMAVNGDSEIQIQSENTDETYYNLGFHNASNQHSDTKPETKETILIENNLYGK